MLEMRVAQGAGLDRSISATGFIFFSVLQF
jgi:hypothetical protein